MAAMTPDEIPPNVRTALLAELFGEWLDAVPTARDAWTLTREEIARKQEHTDEISERMDWLRHGTRAASGPRERPAEGSQ
ncbi:stable inheritance protein KleA [Actinomadura sp. HBU206391]|nr:stable inheritance protein KleA [Actinomadura sp. HBU206391]